MGHLVGQLTARAGGLRSIRSRGQDRAGLAVRETDTWSWGPGARGTVPV